MSEVTFSVERGDKNYPEIEPLYRKHYAEMQKRLGEEGITIADYAPRLDLYFNAFAGGYLINYIARKDGEAIGYSNVYLTNDMHNGELIAQEDTVFILPEHRNGAGRNLIKFVINDLEQRGVKRMLISTVTDTRSGLLMKRLGFKNVAAQMVRHVGD